MHIAKTVHFSAVTKNPSVRNPDQQKWSIPGVSTNCVLNEFHRTDLHCISIVMRSTFCATIDGVIRNGSSDILRITDVLGHENFATSFPRHGLFTFFRKRWQHGTVNLVPSLLTRVIAVRSRKGDFFPHPRNHRMRYKLIRAAGGPREGYRTFDINLQAAGERGRRCNTITISFYLGRRTYTYTSTTHYVYDTARVYASHNINRGGRHRDARVHGWMYVRNGLWRPQVGH